MRRLRVGWGGHMGCPVLLDYASRCSRRAVETSLGSNCELVCMFKTAQGSDLDFPPWRRTGGEARGVRGPSDHLHDHCTARASTHTHRAVTPRAQPDRTALTAGPQQFGSLGLGTLWNPSKHSSAPSLCCRSCGRSEAIDLAVRRPAGASMPCRFRLSRPACG